jgi:hypothetical protein
MRKCCPVCPRKGTSGLRIYEHALLEEALRNPAPRIKIQRQAILTTIALSILLGLAMPATARIPAVKSAQCPPGHMQSGGYCTPMFQQAPTVPKVRVPERTRTQRQLLR